MDYQTVSAFAQTWGLVFLVTMFGGAVIYALWPSNRGKFKKAAHMPLEED
ncbi:cbb3-type cytochrome c oxidase subunit 3 [Nisaea acidiphila]|uniref:Cbb3-type cytochrome c oxidase subunit 3 n=1 Tax=Nisaea acidiphila TaxID=1862145 RepID=A0A9J7AY13_9PROT|nr:cbb3-type cytochrome c oxidase subunit 3 [Nisaea acidiphila]UUX50317.1 cbb3-type cytochrome c oxidase subunit 3 [Nisaea acidiphila]